MENTPPKPIPIMRDNYLAVIRNSIGTTMFRNFYALVEGEKKDLVNNGELSCGFFVSSVLYLFQLIAGRHLTVASTEKDLLESGWQEISPNDLKEGSILVWKTENFDDGPHSHIGFCLGDDRAVSTDYQKGIVTEHHITFGGKRSIEKAYWHEKLA